MIRASVGPNSGSLITFRYRNERGRRRRAGNEWSGGSPTSQVRPSRLHLFHLLCSAPPSGGTGRFKARRGRARAGCWRAPPAESTAACRRRLGSGTGAVRADFQSADASFAARAPAQRGVRRARARPAQLPRQHDLADATLVGGLLVGPRRKATVSDSQLRGALKQCDMPIQGGSPQDLLALAWRTDRVVGDELRLRLLNLHQAAKLRRLGELALAEDLGVRLEEADDLAGKPRVAAQYAGPGLRHHRQTSSIRSIRVGMAARYVDVPDGPGRADGRPVEGTADMDEDGGMTQLMDRSGARQARVRYGRVGPRHIRPWGV